MTTNTVGADAARELASGLLVGPVIGTQRPAVVSSLADRRSFVAVFFRPAPTDPMLADRTWVSAVRVNPGALVEAGRWFAT